MIKPQCVHSCLFVLEIYKPQKNTYLWSKELGGLSFKRHLSCFIINLLLGLVLKCVALKLSDL